MKKIIAAGLMAGMPLLGAGTAQADDCIATQFCGPVARQYPGDRDGARYLEQLCSWGCTRGTVADATKLAETICDGRRKGVPGNYLIAHTKDISHAAAANMISEAMYHFCPQYWDLG